MIDHHHGNISRIIRTECSPLSVVQLPYLLLPLLMMLMTFYALYCRACIMNRRFSRVVKNSVRKLKARWI